MRVRGSGMLAGAVVALALAASGVSACRYDPVPQEVIDDLGDEPGEPGPNHRPGSPCLACHSTYEGATPLAIGGTVYSQSPAETGPLTPEAKVLVLVTDSTGDTRKACSNAAGNFFITKDAWPDITFPLSVTAGGTRMRSLIGREGSCAFCHKPPAEGSSPSGASHDSPGVVLVNAGSAESSCGGAL